MELRFALIYDNQRLDIDEPVGFDAFEPEIERNEMHGVSVEYSDIGLEFTDCEAIAIIQQKYELNLDSVIEFVVEMNCDGDFDEIYRGRLDLSTYQNIKKEYTAVKCKVGQTGVFTTFNNRLETDICLDDLTSLDGSALNDYDYMNYEIEVPGKMVISNAKANDIGVEQEYIPLAFQFRNGDINIIYVPGMINSEGDDLGGFNYSYPQIFTADEWNGYNVPPYFEFKESVIEKPKSNIATYLNFKLRIEAREDLELLPSFNFNYNAKFQLFDENDNLITDIQDTQTGHITKTNKLLEYNFSMSYSLTDFTFKKLYLIVLFNIHVPSTWSEIALQKLSISSLPQVNEYVNITNYSVLPPTIAKTFLLHESLSRISESITNNGLQVWSDYYGRPDSFNGATKPYPPQLTFGQGSLRCLTNGYKLRNYKYTDGSNPKMYISMKKMIQSLAAIDNIGCGFYRAMDKWWFRVENWKWFYQDTELFVINNPSKVERVHDLDETFTRLRIGYKKYADLKEANVIDTFHSERNYSTYAKAVDKEINVLSDFVADPYVIEYTRRKSIDKDTKDWQYDEDIFISCLMRVREIKQSDGVVISDVTRYYVDNGMDNSGGSIISPETMQNVHISPARNALNWADRFSQYPGAKGLSFISGTRNTKAKGKAYMRTNPTITQNGYLKITRWYDQKYDSTIQENADIAKHTPRLKAQLLKFDYPISLAQFNQIRLNPYGYILVDGEKCYLKSVKYNFKTSLANFVLIPSAS